MKKKRMHFRLNMERKRMIEGYIFVTPWIIGLALLFIQPLFTSIRVSFGKIYNIVGLKTEFVGFKNYLQAFVWDLSFIPMFLQTVQVTLTNLPLIVIFALFIAILVNRDLRFKGFFRSIFVLPVLLGTGFVMQQILGQQMTGYAAWLSEWTGPGATVVSDNSEIISRGIMIPREVLLYLGPTTATLVQEFLNRITIMFWKSAVQIIIFLGGLQSIPESLYESAKVDSANEWEMFWKITLPMISPLFILNIIYTIIDSFTDSNNPIVNYVMFTGFKQMNFEYAAAVSWIYLSFVFLLIICIFAISRILTKKYE